MNERFLLCYFHLLPSGAMALQKAGFSDFSGSLERENVLIKSGYCRNCNIHVFVGEQNGIFHK